MLRPGLVQLLGHLQSIGATVVVSHGPRYNAHRFTNPEPPALSSGLSVAASAILAGVHTLREEVGREGLRGHGAHCWLEVYRSHLLPVRANGDSENCRVFRDDGRAWAVD
jgi:hypothetical protein